MKLVLTRVLVFCSRKKNAKKQETQGKLFLAGFIGKFFHNFSHLLCNFILILSEEPYCKNSLKHRITHTLSFSLYFSLTLNFLVLSSNLRLCYLALFSGENKQNSQIYRMSHKTFRI